MTWTSTVSLLGMDTDFAHLGTEYEAFDADEVAEIEQAFEHGVIQRSLSPSPGQMSSRVIYTWIRPLESCNSMKEAFP